MDLEKLFVEAGISSKKTDKGLEVFDGRKRVFTLVALSNVNTKIVYPPGGEYTHTTMWNTPLDDTLVKKQKLHILMAKLQIAGMKL